MSDSPTTFRAEPDDHSGIEWNHRASLHRRTDGGGVLHDFKGIRHATLAELVRYIISLPEDEQNQYVIEKAGDHTLEPSEIRRLARRPDFPR